MPKSSPRIIAVAVSFCLVLSQMGGLAQSNPVPRFAQNEFSAALFCHEAVPAPLEWMQRSQGVGYALRRMAAATLTVLLAGSAAAAAQLAGRAPAGVEDQSLRGRPPTMTFEKALILARKQGGLDIQPEHKKWVEGLFGNFQFWMESSIGHDTMKAWKNRPGDWGVLSFVENLKIQSDMV